MMEKRPPLTSPDGSRNRKTPERCPRPLYSRDPMEEHYEIPQARPLYSRDSTQKHLEIPQARPLYSQDSTQEHQKIPQARPLYSRDSTQEHQKIPQTRPLYSRDSTQEHQEIPQAHPLYSRDSTQEHQEIPQEHQEIPHGYQNGNLIVVKAEVKEETEETSMRGDVPYKDEATPPEISTDTGDTSTAQEKVTAKEEEGRAEIREEAIPLQNSTDGTSNRSTPGRCPFPVYSWDPTQQDHRIPYQYQSDGSLLWKMAAHQQPSTWVRRRKGAGSRKKNLTFSFVENIALIHAVVPFWADLYGERAPYHTFVEKAAMWEQVAAAVNSISRQIRTAQHCRKRVSVIKRQIRFKYIQHRDAIERTGGGDPPRPLVLLPYEKEMMSVIGEELITGLGGDLDTDRPVQLPTEERGVADTFSSAAQSGDILTPGHEEIEALDLAPAQTPGEASSSSPSGEGLMDLSQAPSSLEPQDVTPPIPELPSQAVPLFSPIYDGEDASISSPAPSTQTLPHQLEGASLLQCCMDTQAQLIQEHRRARRSLNLLYREQRRHHLAAERENHRNHLRAEQEAIRHHTRMEEEAAGLTCAVRQLVAIFGGGSSGMDPSQLQVSAQLLRARKGARVTRNRARPSKGGSSAGGSTSKGQQAE